MKTIGTRIILAVLCLVLLGCSDGAIRFEGGIDTDGDESLDGDDTDSGDKERFDGERDWDGDMDLEIDGHSDSPEESLESIRCWQYQSSEVVESENEFQRLVDECETKDSGNKNYICKAVKLLFLDSNGQQFGAQCEAISIPDGDEPLIPDIEHIWLGPEYGRFGNNIFIPGEYPAGFLTVSTSDRLPKLVDAPNWTPDRLNDVLTRELIEDECESIDDYRECVRGFKPPAIHCMPVFSLPVNYQFGDESWEIAEFFSCVSRLEPKNKYPKAYDGDTWLGGEIRNTATGECLYITAPVPPMENWERITSQEEMENCL